MFGGGDKLEAAFLGSNTFAEGDRGSGSGSGRHKYRWKP